MRVLIGCERSGIIRSAFRDAGHDAWSCDLEPAEDESAFHLQTDVLRVLQHGWDLAIFHPECRYLCNSGVLRLYKGGKKENGRDLERWCHMREAAELFLQLWNAPIPRIAIENPIMHRHAMAILNVRHSQTFQPWQFGDDASKRTCLWLKNLPPLLDTFQLVKRRYANQTPSGQNRLGPSPTRSMDRARTYPGPARAMAAQWGSIA